MMKKIKTILYNIFSIIGILLFIFILYGSIINLHLLTFEELRGLSFDSGATYEQRIVVKQLVFTLINMFFLLFGGVIIFFFMKDLLRIYISKKSLYNDEFTVIRKKFIARVWFVLCMVIVLLFLFLLFASSPWFDDLRGCY